MASHCVPRLPSAGPGGVCCMFNEERDRSLVSGQGGRGGETAEHLLEAGQWQGARSPRLGAGGTRVKHPLLPRGLPRRDDPGQPSPWDWRGRRRKCNSVPVSSGEQGTLGAWEPWVALPCLALRSWSVRPGPVTLVSHVRLVTWKGLACVPKTGQPHPGPFKPRPPLPHTDWRAPPSPTSVPPPSDRWFSGAGGPGSSRP